MKVTSQDIRNLAEALPILQKNMHLNTRAVSNLYDCINMAIEDFKKRLTYEDLDEDGDEEAEEEGYEPGFEDDDEEEENKNDD